MTDVDHMTPLYLGGSNERSNLHGLCRACHIIKTRIEQRFANSVSRGMSHQSAIGAAQSAAAIETVLELHQRCDFRIALQARCRKRTSALYGDWVLPVPDLDIEGHGRGLPWTLMAGLCANVRASVAANYVARCSGHLLPDAPIVGTALDDWLDALSVDWKTTAEVERGATAARIRRRETSLVPGPPLHLLSYSASAVLTLLMERGAAERTPPLGVPNPGVNHRWRLLSAQPGSTTMQDS